jgi:hypothetical protein
MIHWDKYGKRYTAKDRDIDEKRNPITHGRCVVCDRLLPCQFHGEAA